MQTRRLLGKTCRCLFLRLALSGFIAGVGANYTAYAQAEVIGEAFGQAVTLKEFNYYYKTAAILTRSGKQDRSAEETRQEAWQTLIFRREAQKLNITVGEEELKEELQRLLSEKNIEYDTPQYRLWISGQFNEDTAVFERRIEDLLIINKFMKLKTEPQVSVTEKEMQQKFLNQYNSFESEYIRFDSAQEAQAFLEKVRANPRLWFETFKHKRAEGQKGAAWINIMSLEALIDLWKIPRDDAYRILGAEEGEFIAAKFFYGDGVFRLLRKREAEMEKYTDKKKEYYRKVLTMVKRRKLVKDYFEDLFARANYRDYVKEREDAAKVEKLKKKSQVALKTSSGVIELKLFPEIAPKACENFVGLIEKGYYDGLIFHRVIKDFMIQGGDPTGTGQGGESIWGEPFPDEISEQVLFDRAGLLAMANSGPNTNKSQFFITVKPTPWLNNKHTIFGEVTSDGLDVVKKIANSSTDANNKPLKEQKIIRAYLLQKQPEKQ